METLLDNLNPEQIQAVTHTTGPLMIIAGAGTGKTTVITRRIGWLIQNQGIKPENILALTFTDKAAAEMEERVDLLLPYGYVNTQISTFHAFCEQVLRDYGVEIGLPRDFTLVDELDAWLLVRQSLDRFELDYYRPMGNPTKYIKALLQHFSRAKDEMVSPDAYLAYAESKKANLDSAQADDEANLETKRLEELARAYHVYQQILREEDALDFGDLILETLRLIRERPHVLNALRERYPYLLVDEFQDTNGAQYELIKKLAAPRNNVTVVGDDDQAIYRFRGASLANILEFEGDFPDAKKVVLVRNYRSGQKILDRAYAFIQANNPNRLEGRPAGDGSALSKRLVSERAEEGHVEHLHFSSLVEEVRGVASKIFELRATHPDATWGDFGVLVRANGSADDFVQVFERCGIPYQFMALRGLYAKGVILDLVAFVRIVDDPYHSPSLYRALAHPLFGLTPHALVTLTHEAHRQGKALYDVCRSVRAISGVDEPTAQAVETLLSLLDRLIQEAKTRTASVMVVRVARESKLVAHVNGLSEARKLEDFRFLHQFHERAKRFDAHGRHPTLRAFLTELGHERDAGEEGSLSPDREIGPDAVRIMTVHGSKGLEFRFVFVVNLVDRRFPTFERRDPIPLPADLTQQRLPGGDDHLEEERRLFYVAITRAKDALFFTSADDYGGARKKKLSRFLHELDIQASAADLVFDVADPFAEETEMSVPTSDTPVPYELPRQFSFTQLRAFETCPLQYKFAHILKIPVFSTWTQSYGKSMHGALQAWFQLWIDREGKSQGGLFETTPPSSPAASVPMNAQELLDLFDKAWIDEWYPSERERDAYKAKGREALKSYAALLRTAPPIPFAVEQAFAMKLGGVMLKGRIDRIDCVEGGVEIVDYKTGAPKDKLEKKDKKQLWLYQLAAERSLGLVPKKLTYHYLDDHSELSFLGTPEELEAFEGEIAEQADRMRASRFEATPGFDCRYCDFRDICEFRQAD
ncbi:ATP-dependent helicase [Candidatus Uhrbacteria bacterium]|nr:ATP-dependent helicase [Candidatus Uhrbacteria bacterium]